MGALPTELPVQMLITDRRRKKPTRQNTWWAFWRSVAEDCRSMRGVDHQSIVRADTELVNQKRVGHLVAGAGLEPATSWL